MISKTDKGGIYARVCMMVLTVMSCVLLSLSVIMRYHHHDNIGRIHYCLICEHVKKCSHDVESTLGCSGCQDNIPVSDDNCGIHLDNFYQDNGCLNLIKQISICQYFLFPGICADILSYDFGNLDLLYICFEKYLFKVYDCWYHVNELRGPPYYMSAVK